MLSMQINSNHNDVFQKVKSGEDIAFPILSLLTSPLNLLIFYRFHPVFKRKFIKLFEFKNC